MTDNLTSHEVLRTPKRSEQLRQRAAWMYFVEEMTQSTIADTLGVGQVTGVRMLADARRSAKCASRSRAATRTRGLEAGLCNFESLRGDRRAAVHLQAGRPGADRGGSWRSRFGAVAQRHEVGFQVVRTLNFLGWML